MKASEFSALSRLFSPAVFREMATKGRSPLFARLFGQSGLSACSKGQSVGEALDFAFGRLRRAGIRSEYVYRAALTHNVLLGTHSLNTASMLTEFRVGQAKADLAILNGTATVYEIKSERDSLARLDNQIANYRKVFGKIYIVVGEAHLNDVLKSVPGDVGIMCLARWNRISQVRDSADLSGHIDPVTIFESVRLSEAAMILRDLAVPVPDVPNTMLHAAMRERFRCLQPVDVQRAMVKSLRRSRNLAPLGVLVDRLPYSLKPAALSIQIRRGDHDRLVDAVYTSLSAALSWA